MTTTTALTVETADAALKPSAGQDMFTQLPALRKVTGISADGPQAPRPKPKLRLVHARD